jgi:hypothetical protein
MKNTNGITKRESKLIRHSLGISNLIATEIVIISGIALAPQLSGRSFHYTTITGLPIYHPSAYARVG